MSRKLDKLESLVNKLCSRYGRDDPDLVHLKTELDTLFALERFDRASNFKYWRYATFRTPEQKVGNVQ